MAGTRTDGLRAKQIGERIRLARKEAGGMPQRELADMLGVTERSIAAYEAGDVIPYRFMRALEDALARPAAWFLYGDEALQAPDHGHDELVERLARIESMLEELLKH